MLRHRADLRTLAIVFAYYALFVTAWRTSAGVWTNAALAAGLCVMAFLVAVVTHNTIHHPIFHRPLLNRVFSMLLSFGFGSPASGFLPGHNLSHHRFLSTAKDNIRTHKIRFRWNFLNQLLFIFAMAPGIIRTEARYAKAVAKQRLARAWSRQHRLEIVLLNTCKVALFLLDWRKALLFVAIPNLYAVWAIFGVNYHQHDGCDETHAYNHSRSFTSPILNFFACNNGYHAVHHERPGLHWSLLPAYHRDHYHGRCHPNLEQKSLIAYLWRSCIYPGTRLNYDGSPMTSLRPAGADEDWVADAFASRAARDVYDPNVPALDNPAADDTWLKSRPVAAGPHISR